jgi:hypothetical protein
MEWVLVAIALTEAPNFTQSHSYYIPLFASQKLCDEALAQMKGEFSKQMDGGARITLRGSCFPRRPMKGATE